MMINTIRAAVLEENQRVVVTNSPRVELLPDECEVTVRAVGLCSSDIARAYGNGAYFYPLIMGHELAGTVTQVGSAINEEFKEGDRVCVFPLLPCFSCLACEKKLYALCRDYDYYGSRRHGGFSEKLNVKAWNILKLPDEVALDDGALIEPTAVVLHAIEKLAVEKNKPSKICLLGAGFMGLIAVQILSRFYPDCEVFLADRNEFKLDIGSDLGAECRWIGSVNAFEDFLLEYDGCFDYVIEFAGTPETFSGAVRLAAQNSKVLWVGNISGDLVLPRTQVSSILRKELTILGVWNSIYKGDGVCDWSKAIDLIHNGLRPSELVTLRIGFDELNETLGKLYAHKTRKSVFNTIKVLVDPKITSE